MRIFSVNVVTKRSDPRSACVSPAGPSNFVPSGIAPDASIGAPDSSSVRHLPTPSKFSSAKPSGSIMAWQLAQTAFWRCSAIRSRIERGWVAKLFGFSSGTLGSGGGGGAPRRFSRIHLPRTTGDVRSAYDVTVSMLP